MNTPKPGPLRSTFSLSSKHSWFHTMFWVIVAVGAGMVAGTLCVLAGAPGDVVGTLMTLWTIIVFAGSVAAAEITKNRRIVSSDRLIEHLTNRKRAR